MPHRLFLREVQLRETPPDAWWAKLPTVRRLAAQPMTFSVPVTFFVGENGTGKSTLLEGIAAAWGFNPEGGSLHLRFSTRNTHSPLHRYLSLGKGPYPKDGFFLRAESMYQMASAIDDTPGVIGVYGGVSLHRQSHGESFLSLVQNRFLGEGLYLLDEPEAALSPTRQLTLLTCIHQLAAAGSQFIIATHSPLLMACPDAEILLFNEAGIRPVRYTDTDHYLVTRAFLNHPEEMLRRLLHDSDDS